MFYDFSTLSPKVISFKLFIKDEALVYFLKLPFSAVLKRLNVCNMKIFKSIRLNEPCLVFIPPSVIYVFSYSLNIDCS